MHGAASDTRGTLPKLFARQSHARIGVLEQILQLHIIPVPDRDFCHVECNQNTTVDRIWVAGTAIKSEHWRRPQKTASTVVKTGEVR